MHKVLLKISVATMVEAEEAVAALLERVFRRSPALYTDDETLITEVSVYLPDPRAWSEAKRARLQRGLARIRALGLPIGSARVRVRRLRVEDWAESWKRHFRPLLIGDALLVKPTWSRRRPVAGQVVVELDPGLSFGTGQHPTTRFCLDQVVAARRRFETPSLLDLGTGSGILAIAAAKLGFAPVDAVDFDPVAVKAAKANARANGVARRIHIARADVRRLPLRPLRCFHVVCANLLDDLLVAETRRIAAQVHPDGTLVLAGILARQFPLVRAAYEAAGMGLTDQRIEREWQSGAFRWRSD